MQPEYGQPEIAAHILPGRGLSKGVGIEKSAVGIEVLQKGLLREQPEHLPGPGEHVALIEKFAARFQHAHRVLDDIAFRQVAPLVPSLPPGIGKLDEYHYRLVMSGKDPHEVIYLYKSAPNSQLAEKDAE